MRQGMRMSRNHMRVLHQLCPSLQCTSGELLKAKKNVLPLFTRELTNSRLLVDVCFFLLRSGAKKMKPCTQELTRLLLFMFADGVYPRGRGNINLQVAIVDRSGNLIPPIPPIDTDIRGSTMLLTWREMSTKEFNVWWMEGRIKELNLLQKMKFPIAQTSGVISPDFTSGDHHFNWSETRTNKCHMEQRFLGTHNLTTNPGFWLSAVQNVENIQFEQPILHNPKGTVSRFFLNLWTSHGWPPAGYIFGGAFEGDKKIRCG